MKRLLILLATIVLVICGCASKSGGPSNVLVVMNENSPDSVEVANYYAAKRSIAPRFICKIRCPSEEVVKDDVFEKTIRQPIRQYLSNGKLEDSIDYIVLTRGIPIRTAAQWGVDSALTCLSKTEDVKMFNPYYREQKPFSHAEYGIYLVTRLDGLTLADAKALVDRSLAAKPEKGLFLLDISPGWDGNPGYKVVNDWMRKAAEILKEKGFEVELDEKVDFIVRSNLMGYYGWGFHDDRFTTEAYKKLGFLPGSIAETAVSTSAYTLTANRTLSGTRSYITDLVAQGATGVKGYVYEPFISALAEADVLFDRYTSGYNLAESFYASSRFVHWRDIVLGDPLCAPFAKTAPKP